MTERSARTSAYYSASVASFVADSPSSILGSLTAAHAHDLEISQRGAWEVEIAILKTALQGVTGTLFLEFDVPRLGSRIDAVLISGSAIFPIEFKCGESRFHTADLNQAWDYALDLKNFHAASHNAPIFPILLATEARSSDSAWSDPHPDGVRRPYRCGLDRLRPAIDLALARSSGPPVDALAWGAAPYRPTPTIVEAARTLYTRHSVEAISRHDAGARNLSVTSAGVEEVIERARANRTKSIVFVTGVPGAGKTLVGLNIATRRKLLRLPLRQWSPRGGLQEALTRDEFARPGNTDRKGVIQQRVKPFIQNVHHFRDATREPGFYNETYRYLRDLGVAAV